MARKSLDERLDIIDQELETVRDKHAKLEQEWAERFGRLALKAGIRELRLTNAQQKAELEAIVEKYKRGNSS